MSLAHAGSNIKDLIIPVDYQDTLFHFYWNKVSGRGHEPIQDVTTFVDDDKFGRVIAIEDGTTNLYSSQAAFHGQNVSASYDPNTKEWTVTVPSGSTQLWRGIFYIQRDAVFSPGEKGTVSCEVWANESGIPLFIDINNFGLSKDTGINDNDIVANRIYRVGSTIAGKWVKISATFEFSPSATQNFYDQSTFIIDNGWVPSGDKTIKIRNIQCEKKSWPTSFVNGSRGVGVLEYPKEMFPQKDFTVNMWISHTGDTRLAQMEYKLFSLGSDVTTSRLTIWNFCPITSDFANRRIISDYGNNDSGGRQYKDLVDPVLFVPGQWEMFTITFEYSTKKFTYYRNGNYWDTYTPAKLNPIHSVLLYNSGWKYSNLLISPRVFSPDEIRLLYHYGKPLYDPYNYYTVFGA